MEPRIRVDIRVGRTMGVRLNVAINKRILSESTTFVHNLWIEIESALLRLRPSLAAPDIEEVASRVLGSLFAHFNLVPQGYYPRALISAGTPDTPQIISINVDYLLMRARRKEPHIQEVPISEVAWEDIPDPTALLRFESANATLDLAQLLSQLEYGGSREDAMALDNLLTYWYWPLSRRERSFPGFVPDRRLRAVARALTRADAWDSFLTLWRVRKGPLDWQQHTPSQPGSHVTLWFATNRTVIANASEPPHFSATPDENRTTYGRCRVWVPLKSSWGLQEHHFKPLRVLRFVFGRRDDYVLTSVEQLDRSNFFEGIRRASGDSVLLYVHGYNVPFELAAKRAAQIAMDIHPHGPVVFFSWPSLGTLEGYASDEERIALSELHIKALMMSLRSEFPDKRLIVLGHSMGSRALVGFANLDALNVPISEVVFAAPDVNTLMFRRCVADLGRIARRVTLYVSSGDRALKASTGLHAFSRVGLKPPVVTFDGVDTIDVSDTDMSFLGHSYYADCEAVLYDLYYLSLGVDAGRRARLREVKSGESSYWAIRA